MSGIPLIQWEGPRKLRSTIGILDDERRWQAQTLVEY